MTLATKYGWTFDIISRMTNAQQMAALDLDNVDVNGRGQEVVRFQDVREAEQWMRAQKQSRK